MNYKNSDSDIQKFEREWVALAREICQAIYINPKVQELKNNYQTNNFLSLEEQSEFINICDRIKYEVIFKKFGQEDSDGYRQFSLCWQEWFKNKGVGSSQNRGQRNSVDHILFGSTPDPERFLLHFEEEILGSMK